ncbi:helix-turn-helix domain-containing protein [Roseinatronobacter bogoriensis]|uniref:helix-turn-helix domain-containing protein n=1 Tax=Roseinatronobacter bogoriensis TaxID=119542 RepID=UPI00160D7E5D|nr:helix-turn-helix transcriptional regulator [Rhodobaca bogoriensis]
MMTLHEYLKSNAIRQMDFAPRIGVTQGTVSRFCTGRAVPDIITAAKIQKETDGAVPMAVWAPEEYRLGAQTPQKGVV